MSYVRSLEAFDDAQCRRAHDLIRPCSFAAPVLSRDRTHGAEEVWRRWPIGHFEAPAMHRKRWIYQLHTMKHLGKAGVVDASVLRGGFQTLKREGGIHSAWSAWHDFLPDHVEDKFPCQNPGVPEMLPGWALMLVTPQEAPPVPGLNDTAVTQANSREVKEVSHG